MEKKAVLGELLYIGFVAEKGRCNSKGIWKIGYKKQLYQHITLLNNISQCLNNDDVTANDVQVIKNLFALCNSESEFKRFYPIQNSLFQEIKEHNYIAITHNEMKKSENINRLLIEITGELLQLLKERVFLNKKRIKMLFRAGHNLPRYYLNDKEKTLCNIMQPPISYQEAIEYSFSNMDEETKMKYEELMDN